MPSNSRWKHRFEEFKASLKELKKGLKLPRYNVVDRAGVIRLFEASLDLALKTIKARLVFEGHEAKSPKTAIRKAAEIGLIADLDSWLEMWSSRNELRQVADQEKAKKSLRLIKGRFSQLLFLLSKTINKVKSKSIIHDKHVRCGVEEIKWTEKTLGALIQDDHAALQTGPFGTMLKADEYTLDGIPVIAVQDIGDNRLRHEKIVKVSHETATRLARYRVQENDIIFSRKGSVERRAIVTKEEDGWLQGSDCIRLRINKNVDPRFISYQLGSQFHKSLLRQYAHGATMPSLNQGILELLPFRLPPYPSQTRIADILTSLDDKIELNRKMNETLEEMAQALFKRWFVDFEFPNEHGKPYKSAGGKMVDSPMGKIPKGWTVGCLKDIARNPRRNVQPNNVALGTPYIALEHMPKHSIALPDWEMVEALGSNKHRFVRNEILFGKLRPYFHKVGIAPVDGVCSTDIVVITPLKPDWFGMVLCIVSNASFVAYTSAGSTGTRMPRTSWKDMEKFEIALPSPELASLFNNVVQPLSNTIISNVHELRTLAELRDHLLPRLLSGEIVV